MLDGLSPELALDVTLNELVVRATSATQASAAALALARGVEMVCRATTGDHAPDLGVPLNTREGLSGACLHSRRPQLCHDTESDPRVDAAASRRLGVRSMLIVPAMDGDDLVGVLEVFSPHPGAFSESHQILLETFARDCARLRRFALELAEWPPEPPHPLKEEGSDVETRLAALPDPVPASGETSLEFSELRSPVDDSSLPTLALSPAAKTAQRLRFLGSDPWNAGDCRRRRPQFPDRFPHRVVALVLSAADPKRNAQSGRVRVCQPGESRDTARAASGVPPLPIRRAAGPAVWRTGRL